MQTVTVSRTIAASPEETSRAMHDLVPFIRASGFDSVDVDDRDIRVSNKVGPAEITLHLKVVDDADAELAYEQRKGIFEEMRTSYRLEPVSDGVEVTATTEFALDVALIGEFLDSTVISRQRRKELEAQFDYLEEATNHS
ncbi:hypothetical protein DEQ92_19905 [Haloferax sp. Atlit-6N]|uniref:START domain protein n=1 Tax=Haloferax gibbonsii TaxID=35746 RepID=A0A871BKW4_HALGI|nr:MULTISPECIES: SRPBCC family protein [Haloferax]QOS13439.1 START domain protein [Haloferax gibbonsii]REA00535.1 hypothetical protein DEQ92_19905 [Haloferax sp. Atlit-6N]